MSLRTNVYKHDRLRCRNRKPRPTTHGILRMRFRNSRQREELMQPGEINPITIDLWAISNVFRKIHKIRLDISSSNFPMYDRNPNTGEPLGRHTHMITTVNTIYHDPEHRSFLLLPVRQTETQAKE